MAKAKEHLLSSALRVWADIRTELEDKPADQECELAETGLEPEELQKVAKWLQHTVTKFSASAAVADGPKDPALKAVSEEVVKSFTAALGTLLSLRRGACSTLRAELRDLASSLAKAVDALGASVGSPGMSVCAGQVLDRVQHLQRVSHDNRSAALRRVMASLKQLRDAKKELADGLKEEEAGDDEDGSDGDCGDLDDLGGLDELEPEERVVMEAAAVAMDRLDERLKKVYAFVSSKQPLPPVALAEALAVSAGRAQRAVDGLIAHGMGGMDVKACGASLADLREAAGGLSIEAGEDGADALRLALDAVREALDRVPDED